MESGFRARVLIVDDNRNFVGAVRELVNGIPWLDVIGTARSAEEALDLIREAPPEVALMDINLPGMDGIEATRRIRAECPDVRVIVLTVMNSPEYERAAIEAGAAAFLVKSDVGHELPKVIEKIFSTNRGNK
jgi:DNA-binding NarL/FixJ family response regulator